MDRETNIADQLTRFGMALAVVGLCAACLYQFSGFANYSAPGKPGVVFHYSR